MTLPRSRLSLVPPAAAAEGAGGGDALDAHGDDDLMRLARGGMTSAFAALVRRHQARALRVAARRLGRSPVAADVVQNTFLEIYRALPRYQPRGRFASYLYRVLLNQCAMVHRSARVEAGAELAPPPDAVGQPSQEAAILARERERDVEAALGRLSARLRDVVLLRYSGELPYDEIAEALGIPIGTVKRRLFDAMEKLRQMLEER